MTAAPMPKQIAQESTPAIAAERAVDQHLDRLQNDLTKLKQQLYHAQKLSALGTNAAVLAHEINNLLTPPLGYAKFALEQNDPSLMAKAVTITVKQIHAVVAMTDRILSMAANEPEPRNVVKLADAVQHAIQCLCRDVKKDGITMTVDVADHLTVQANQNQLEQVFFNLLLNARDALSGRTGQIIIRARSTDDDLIEIAFSDTGTGIAAEHLDEIFDDFFTTKNDPQTGEKHGTGLGLSVCRDIIDEHRGTITVQSPAGGGTTFTISLPKTD